MSSTRFASAHLHAFAPHAQVVVRGIPWSYTWRELKDMFVDFANELERADVVYGEDGRSRVGGALALFVVSCVVHRVLGYVCRPYRSLSGGSSAGSERTWGV